MMEKEMNSPYTRESFAHDSWAGKTVEVLAESLEYLTLKRVYFSKKLEKQFGRKAVIRPEKENIDSDSQNKD